MRNFKNATTDIMKIVSIIDDGLLKARSILMEMTISEYLNIGRQILNKNRYQRRRVKNGPAMYGLLSKDLLHLCTMPPIVLAFREQQMGLDLSLDLDEANLCEKISTNDLLILDGLQRTYTMMGIETDLLVGPKQKEAYLAHTIRVEVYAGLSHTGILYRMLTLNSGQTPMSKRHQIEILYSHFRDNKLDDIQFILQTDPNSKIGLDQYDFDDAIEGFNSFLTTDEAPIDKYEIRVIAERLDKIANDDYEKDIFERFMRTYNNFVHCIDHLSDSWVYVDPSPDEKKNPYGRDIPRIFSKSQTISAFGAAVGFLIESEKIRSLSDIEECFSELRFENNVNTGITLLLNSLEDIRKRAPKIGIEQRIYLRLFFDLLFSPESETRFKIEASVKQSFQEYTIKRWKQNIAEPTSLF